MRFRTKYLNLFSVLVTILTAAYVFNAYFSSATASLTFKAPQQGYHFLALVLTCSISAFVIYHVAYESFISRTAEGDGQRALSSEALLAAAEKEVKSQYGTQATQTLLVPPRNFTLIDSVGAETSTEGSAPAATDNSDSNSEPGFWKKILNNYLKPLWENYLLVGIKKAWSGVVFGVTWVVSKLLFVVIWTWSWTWFLVEHVLFWDIILHGIAPLALIGLGLTTFVAASIGLRECLKILTVPIPLPPLAPPAQQNNSCSQAFQRGGQAFIDVMTWSWGGITYLAQLLWTWVLVPSGTFLRDWVLVPSGTFLRDGVLVPSGTFLRDWVLVPSGTFLRDWVLVPAWTYGPRAYWNYGPIGRLLGAIYGFGRDIYGFGPISKGFLGTWCRIIRSPFFNFFRNVNIRIKTFFLRILLGIDDQVKYPGDLVGPGGASYIIHFMNQRRLFVQELAVLWSTVHLGSELGHLPNGGYWVPQMVAKLSRFPRDYPLGRHYQVIDAINILSYFEIEPVVVPDPALVIGAPAGTFKYIEALAVAPRLPPSVLAV